jgi:broad specificity phosphatase PhoE
MKNIIKSIFSLTIILCSVSAFSAEPIKNSEDNSYTIYLVRHAEKQIVAGEKNPELTLCGVKRAEQLASILENVKLTSVYSTNYKRTMATAKPTAQQKQLTIKNYNPRELSQFAEQLINEKQNILVVGHSNTTPQLAQLISKHSVKELTELEYQELYQVQIVGDKRTLIRLKQPLECS